VGRDSLRLARPLEHKQLREDGDGFKPDGEGPDEFEGGIGVVEEEGEDGHGWEKVGEAEGVEGGVLGRSAERSGARGGRGKGKGKGRRGDGRAGRWDGRGKGAGRGGGKGSGRRKTSRGGSISLTKWWVGPTHLKVTRMRNNVYAVLPIKNSFMT